MQDRPSPTYTKRSAKILLAARFILVSIFLVCTISSNALGLEPKQVLVIVNDNVSDSRLIGNYYIKRRNVPDGNVFHISCPSKEEIPRSVFEAKIEGPLRKHLCSGRSKGPSGAIKCILLTYGVPLRIKQEKKMDKGSKTPLKFANSCASVDSELMTLCDYGSYPLKGWIPNPLLVSARNKPSTSIQKDRIFMVSRIDGPDIETAKRIIDDAIYAEKNGLCGRGCLDCRYSSTERRSRANDAYSIFDGMILKAGQFLNSRGIPTVINQSDKLFEKGECEKCALYCGWYSLSRYVDTCSWAKGAIAYHVASSECVSLHGKNNQWCRMLLKKGACVTIGPVAEPYLQTFPYPELFFRLLLDNALCVARAYLLSLPALSWKMILVADPLYRPFIHSCRKRY